MQFVISMLKVFQIFSPILKIFFDIPVLPLCPTKLQNWRGSETDSSCGLYLWISVCIYLRLASLCKLLLPSSKFHRLCIKLSLPYAGILLILAWYYCVDEQNCPAGIAQRGSVFWMHSRWWCCLSTATPSDGVACLPLHQVMVLLVYRCTKWWCCLSTGTPSDGVACLPLHQVMVLLVYRYTKTRSLFSRSVVNLIISFNPFGSFRNLFSSVSKRISLASLINVLKCLFPKDITILCRRKAYYCRMMPFSCSLPSELC
jgi:hypothetical protein